ncbi:hypothetical protein ACFQZC_08920 [Streptacidiphilus monticola]
MPKPTSAAAAFDLLTLADLGEADCRPPAAWFDADVLAQAESAASELREAAEAERAARERAQDAFSPQVCQAAELPALVQRFAEQHHGITARFSSQYKADRAAVAALTVSGAWHKNLPRRLDDALAWHQAAGQHAALREQHRRLLGRYAPGRTGRPSSFSRRSPPHGTSWPSPRAAAAPSSWWPDSRTASPRTRWSGSRSGPCSARWRTGAR